MLKLTLTILFLFLCLLLSQAFAQCEIQTFERIIITREFNSSEAQNSIKYTNCSSKILSSFREVLASGQGTFNSYWFNKVQSHPVSIKPQKIRLTPLDELITKKVLTKPNWYFQNSQILGRNKSAFYLNEGDHLHINACPTCSRTGEKNIKIHISNPIKRTQRTEWVKGDILIKAKALILKEHIGPSNGPLQSHQFEVKETMSTNPERLFANKRKVIFYKLNKPKRAGESLNFSDLVPVRLVFPGKPVQIIFTNNGINLSSKAMPMQSGKFGESIQLKNITTKRAIVGKIVGFNKVAVEL